MKKIDWIIHLVANGVKCSECNETENGFLPNMCDAHTHGMDKYGHQEFQIVLMIGAELICYILNALGLRVQAGESFKDGDSVAEIIRDYNIRIKEVEVDGKKLLRVILPDAQGCFPEDVHCAEYYNQQHYPMEMLYHAGQLN